jgi:copper chaperone CopZ
MKTLKLFALFALLIFSWSAKPASAQVEQIEMRVDGLACPFCAYGLEKKLKEIKGVEKVTVYVDKGLVALKSRKEGAIMIDRLEPVVKDAGFTPGEIKLIAVGKIGQLQGAPMFEVSGPEMAFVIKNDAQYEKLRVELNGTDKLVRVTGRLAQETPQGHHAHPHTLTIQEYMIK